MKKPKYEEKIKTLFNINNEGISRKVLVTEIQAAGLPWTKNGNIRRGVPTRLDPRYKYKWKIFRKNIKNNKSEVLALKTCGLNLNVENIKNNIRSDIKKHFNKINICNISLLPLNANNGELDHRWGFKEHKKYSYLQNLEYQTVDDFQLIHKSLNLIKREICKKCRNRGIRPDHPEKSFVVGTEKLDDVNVCEGCYLAQPERYR
jgi:hypothetical protein